ncbi:MAG: alanine--glyoxylate aminotransferase family protein [Candidatus Latescibacteria bacterium]|nr:alanine--glyoxylate aminotransferase family protein [Candidatus Latescibacterota bacterium]
MSTILRSPKLMIPGPMDCPDEVLRRLGHQVFPHYDAPTGFPEFYNTLADKMKYIFGMEDDGRVFIPNGSGTVSVNMAIASLCTTDDEVLVIENGGLGDYAAKNLNALGIPFAFVHGEWGKAIDPGLVREAMRKKRRTIIYMTHNESSTAVVNPITPIGEIAREFDALVISDSISAIGGVVCNMGENGADVICGASQKALELPPGLAPVGVSGRAWDYMEKMKNRRVPWILDLMEWRNAGVSQRDFHPQPVTGATTMLYALDWVVDRIREEGIENRESRFRAAGKRLKDGMAELGFPMSADPADASPVVTDFFTPHGIDANIVRSYYLEKHDTMVGYGFAHMEEKTGRNLSFRVAHFGVAAEPARVDHMIGITRRFVEEELDKYIA